MFLPVLTRGLREIRGSTPSPFLPRIARMTRMVRRNKTTDTNDRIDTPKIRGASVVLKLTVNRWELPKLGNQNDPGDLRNFSLVLIRALREIRGSTPGFLYHGFLG